MARKKSPTLLPEAPDLQLVRLEVEEQSLIAIVATTSSGACCPLCQCRGDEHPLALYPCSSRFALGRVGSAARTACAALLLPQRRMSAPDFRRAFARSGGCLCPTNGTSLRPAHAAWVRGR